MLKVILWIACIIYCASPVDLFPGPVDDAITAVAVCAVTSLIPSNKSNSDSQK